MMISSGSGRVFDTAHPLMKRSRGRLRCCDLLRGQSADRVPKIRVSTWSWSSSQKTACEGAGNLLTRITMFPHEPLLTGWLRAYFTPRAREVHHKILHFVVEP